MDKHGWCTPGKFCSTFFGCKGPDEQVQHKPQRSQHQGEKEDERNQVIPRHRPNLGDVGDERQIQDQQDQVAEVHGNDHRPEDLGLIDH